MKPEVDGPPRHRCVAGEAVKHAARRRRALVLQDREGVLVRLAGMDHHRAFHLARHPNLTPKHLALDLARARNRSDSRDRSPPPRRRRPAPRRPSAAAAPRRRDTRRTLRPDADARRPRIRPPARAPTPGWARARFGRVGGVEDAQRAAEPGLPGPLDHRVEVVLRTPRRRDGSANRTSSPPTPLSDSSPRGSGLRVVDPQQHRLAVRDRSPRGSCRSTRPPSTWPSRDWRQSPPNAPPGSRGRRRARCPRPGCARRRSVVHRHLQQLLGLRNRLRREHLGTTRSCTFMKSSNEMRGSSSGGAGAVGCGRAEGLPSEPGSVSRGRRRGRECRLVDDPHAVRGRSGRALPVSAAPWYGVSVCRSSSLSFLLAAATPGAPAAVLADGTHPPRAAARAAVPGRRAARLRTTPHPASSRLSAIGPGLAHPPPYLRAGRGHRRPQQQRRNPHRLHHLEQRLVELVAAVGGPWPAPRARIG